MSYACQGANHRLGLKFAKKFTEQGWNVSGSIRSQTIDDESVAEVSSPNRLGFTLTNEQQLKDTGVRIFVIDYLDEATIAKAAEGYGYGSLDCLLNCDGKSKTHQAQ